MSSLGASDNMQAGHVCRDGRYVFFYHMPKTGGLTIVKYITARFAPQAVFRPAKNKALFSDFFARRKFVLSQHATDTHIIGHFASWSLLENREQKYYKACLWRHPADWFLSFYNFRLHRNSEKIKRPFSFADFYKSMLRNPMTEHFLLYCGDVPGWRYFLMSDRKKFEAACALAQRFDCFADIAHVYKILDVIGVEGERRPPDYNRIPSHEKFLGSLDGTTRVAINRTNAVDFYLHRLAQSKDRQRVVQRAQRSLSPHFKPSDILRLIRLPYYRFKTWVLPFISFPIAVHPTRPEPPHQAHRNQ